MLPDSPVPSHSLVDASRALARLGEKLFFDRKLSGDGTISCGSCHQPDKAFSDGRALAEGIGGKRGTRNTPSILDAALSTTQFWDGRRATLEDQAIDPFVNPSEHGLANHAAVLARIREDASYERDFGAAFSMDGSRLSMQHVRKALATYIRSLNVSDSAFDRFEYGGDKSALSDSARRGLELFRGRAQCSSCHTIGKSDAVFSDGCFHVAGVETARIAARLPELTARVVRAPSEQLDGLITTDPDVAALGRFVVTRDPRDIGAFRTPSLRNVARTAPYMHDGGIATLGEAVDQEIYYRSAKQGRPIVLTHAERIDLVNFLEALTSESLNRFNPNREQGSLSRALPP